jgi:cytochrome d ubiquinol oxidase subunit II
MRWWRNTWDIAYSASSAILALLLGIVLGNVLQGFEIGPNFSFQGNWLFFINPYSLIVGMTTLALMTMHGAIYLSLKTEGRLFLEVRKLLIRSMAAFIILFIIMSLYTILFIPHLTDRFRSIPYLAVFPVLALLAIANIPRLISKRNYLYAFFFSSLTFSFLLLMVAIELYPTLLISTLSEEFSITVHNAASSKKSLGIMLMMAVIGTPLVLTYTFIVYRTFWGKVKMDETSY